jgi:hypothetical protein
MIEQPTTARRALRPVADLTTAIPSTRLTQDETTAWRTVAGIESATTAIPAARSGEKATTAVPATGFVESLTTAVPAPTTPAERAAVRAAELASALRSDPILEEPTSLVPAVRPVEATALVAQPLPGEDDASAIEETSVIQLAQPVFVDGTGRRTRRTKVIAYTVASACVAMLALVGVSLAAGQHTPMLQIPLLGGDSTASAETQVEEAAAPAATAAAPEATRSTTTARAVAPRATTAKPTRAAPAPVVPVVPSSPAGTGTKPATGGTEGTPDTGTGTTPGTGTDPGTTPGTGTDPGTTPGTGTAPGAGTGTIP